LPDLETNSRGIPNLEQIDWPAEFPILDRSIFFNHAAVAPIPARSAEALRLFADEAALEGASAWGRWAERLKATRKAAASLLGCDLDEIGFVHNTTHGLLCLANSLPWRPGDNIVGIEHEFPANVHPWRNLRRLGVALRTVPESPDYRYGIDDFAERIDSRTRLVTTSLVNYSTGYRLPVEEISQLCRERDILFCLDAIQGVGAMPTRPGELGCDFLVADGHKWMLGPEGIGLLYVRKERMDVFNEAMTGWVGRVRSWDYGDLEQPLASTARRFEEGSYNMAGAAALGQSLALIDGLGIGRVWDRLDSLTARLAEGLTRKGYQITSPRGKGERSGIIAATREGLDPEVCARRLVDRDIHISARRGWLRFSPHFYNQPEQVDRVLDALG